jgi:hypothetical protein
MTPHQLKLSKAKRENLYLVSLIILTMLVNLGIRIYISQFSGLMYDEPVTLHLAKEVALGKLPFRDFYEHHSMLPWYLLAPLSNLSIWRLQRLLIAIGGSLALVGLYRLSASLWGVRVGIIAILLGMVSPLWQHQGNMVIHDSFLVVALVVALLVWWHALQKSSSLMWILAGICAGLVVNCKQTGVLSALALIIGVLIFTRSIKAILAYILGGILTLIPSLILYWGQYHALFQGLLGWNLAANAHLDPNPKFIPFINDIFLANPILWGVGFLAAIIALRGFRKDFQPGDPSPLLTVSGMIVIFVLVFNWYLSKQTFNQYYLQAVPALILLTAPALYGLFNHPLSIIGKVGLYVVIIYLGAVNPLMNALTPWTPDLKEKLQIADWIRQEIDDQAIWEPWVYYAHLAEKDFNFYYPFLSIHSMRNDPELPTIDGQGIVGLDNYLVEEDIRWVVLHQPLMPGLDTHLDRMFTAGPQDWQLIRSFQVTRYASESGMQHHFWTPWWRPLIFYESITVWYRHPGERHGGMVGQLKIVNPTDLPNLYLEVQHDGGIDLYQLDERSIKERDYLLNWHQTGHGFFLSEGPFQIDHQSGGEDPGFLTISVAFSEGGIEEAQTIYKVSIPKDQDNEYCLECLTTYQCRSWVNGAKTCEENSINDYLTIDAIPYKPIDESIIEK